MQALLAGPADGLLLFEADLPPGTSEHAIQIEMAPGGLPVVRLDVESRASTCALDHLLGARPHQHRPRGRRTSTAPTFALRRERMVDAAGRRAADRRRRRSPSSRPPRPRRPLLEQDVTAVFCDDDILAGGVYLAARARGHRDPGRPVGRRVRRPRLRAGARAAADDGRGRRGGAGRRGVRGVGARPGGRSAAGRAGHAGVAAACASRPRRPPRGG